jgi:hypothetical protein
LLSYFPAVAPVSLTRFSVKSIRLPGRFLFVYSTTTQEKRRFSDHHEPLAFGTARPAIRLKESGRSQLTM